MQDYDVKVYDNRTEWRRNGKLHRIDGPAVEYADGDKFWFQNGKRHRENGPAVENSNGNKYWYQNDVLHRTDGPAVENADGYVEYWENGKQIPDPNATKEMTVEQICEQLGYNVKVVK